MATLLLVTDETTILDFLKIELKKVGHSVVVAKSIKVAKSLPQKVHCVICECRLADGSGLDLIAHFKHTPLILLVDQASLPTGLIAMRRGAFDCFTTPLHKKDLIRAINKATAVHSHLINDDCMIGQSEPILRLKNQISRVAPLDTTILISGELGTGKELVASAIHQQSQRCTRDNISVNCASMCQSLIEAELFGHVKGAFPGAAKDHLGLIEYADQSTLFLDEIDRLPLEGQSRLLRVLQEGKIQPVGSTERRRIDVRLIAATQKNLLDLVALGQFREDLYYQLNIIELHCPALRERGDDIMVLGHAFLNKMCKDLDAALLKFSKEAELAIINYQWPGNIREFYNALERAVVMCDGPLIGAVDLGLQKFGLKDSVCIAGEQQHQSKTQPMMSLEDYFQYFVLSHEDHMSETELAQRLGISRKSLWERRNRLGIPRRKESNEG